MLNFKTMSLFVSAKQEKNKVIRESEPGHKHVLIQTAFVLKSFVVVP